MNVIASTPGMCLANATGLCTQESSTKDSKIQQYHTDYKRRMMARAKRSMKAVALDASSATAPPKNGLATRGKLGGKRAAKAEPKGAVRALQPEPAKQKWTQDVYMLPTYPTIPASSVMSGLASLSCATLVQK